MPQLYSLIAGVEFYFNAYIFLILSSSGFVFSMVLRMIPKTYPSMSLRQCYSEISMRLLLLRLAYLSIARLLSHL